MHRCLVAVWMIAACVLAVAPAAAQDVASSLRQAERAFRRADFEGASEIVERLARADVLTPQELAQIVELEVAVAYALRDEPRLTRALEHLRVVAPDAQLTMVPRSVRDRFAALRQSDGVGRVELDVALERTAGGVRVHAEASAPQGLVQSVSVAAREPGATEWHRGDARVVVPTVDATSLEVAIAAHGPGGVVLASEGTEDSPAVHQLDLELEPRLVTIPTARDDGDDGVWIGLGVGAGVLLAAGAVVLAVALGTSSDPVLVGPAFP